MSSIEEEVREEMEEEEEEEESLVLVELHGVIDSEIFAQDSFSKFKVLAVDSEQPVLQVENFIFLGEYEHTLGTAAFFEEEEKRLKCDPVFCKKPPRMLRYACNTNKKLSMKRVFVSEKSGSGEVKHEGVPGSSHLLQGSSDPSQPQEPHAAAAAAVTDTNGEGGSLAELPVNFPQLEMQD